MKKITYTLNASILSFVFISFVGCVKDEISDLEIDQKLVAENTVKATSGGSCSGDVNFADLLVETSWISGDKDDRDQFGACGVDGEAWMDQYSDGRMMLKSLAAHGQRTELKEDNGDEANLSDYKRMTFTARFSDLPSNGVTIAQIHNRSNHIKRPWIRLYIDSDGKFKIKKTNTTPKGATSNYTTIEGMQYSSNQPVTVNIWTGVNGGEEKARIKVEYNGETFTRTLTPSTAWNNLADKFYLKAGVYTEGDDTKQAKVVYSYFFINH